MRDKLCYILSDISASNNIEWTLRELKKKHPLHVILLDKKSAASRMQEFLSSSEIPFLRIFYRNKLSLALSVFKIMKYLATNRIGIVHCHLFEASLAGLVAARLCGVRKRIHTRHNSTIHLKYYPSAVKYDKLINSLSTHIVSISNAVTRVLTVQEKAPPEKIVLIPHGFDFHLMRTLSESQEQVRKKYGIPPDKKIIGIVSRYIHYKGLQYSLPAVARLLQEKNAFLVLANSGGPQEEMVRSHLSRLKPDTYIEIPFEENPYALFSCFDLFVHAPVSVEDEAFGQVYIEAMAMRVPVITTRSGVVADIPDAESMLEIVSFESEEEIYASAIKLLAERPESKIERAYRYATENFEIGKMVSALEKLYSG